MFRVLWPFWSLRDHLDQARTWVDQLVPDAGSLDPHTQAELLWTAAVTANRAAMPRRRKQPANGWHRCWAHIDDPYLRALSGLAMEWASLAAGDPDGAIRHESASLEELPRPRRAVLDRRGRPQRRLHPGRHRPRRRRSKPPEPGT